MYLLNRRIVSGARRAHRNLHSTMYLLNRGVRQPGRKPVLFTFHYVSIKSLSILDFITVLNYLHSTMYLLNQCCCSLLLYLAVLFTFNYVSIKSYIARHRVRRVRIYIPLCIY